MARGEDPHRDECEEEGAEERNCYELTATPHSRSPCTARDGKGEVEELVMKRSPGERWWQVVLVFLFVSHYSTLF